jgi:hypothetical protein
MITDLVYIKPVFKEICSTRCLELFKKGLLAPTHGYKQHIFQIVQLLVKKHQDPAVKNRWKSADSDDDEETKATAAGPSSEAGGGPQTVENPAEILEFF